jgi:hypothetical protein
MSEAPDRAAGGLAGPRDEDARNSAGSVAVLCIAFAPQLAVLAYCILRVAASLFSFLPGVESVAGRFPLALGLSVFAEALADRNLLEIYSLPLIAIAIFTFFPRIRSAQDYFGGVALIAVALFAFWASSDLAGQRGFSFGPGTAPRLFSGLLALLGAAVVFTGLMKDGSPLQQFAFRGPFFVTLSIVVFSIAIRPLGLVLSGIITFLVAAMGSPETRWIEAFIVGVLLTLVCAFLFPYALGLPFQLWPQFLTQ